MGGWSPATPPLAQAALLQSPLLLVLHRVRGHQGVVLRGAAQRVLLLLQERHAGWVQRLAKASAVCVGAAQLVRLGAKGRVAGAGMVLLRVLVLLVWVWARRQGLQLEVGLQRRVQRCCPPSFYPCAVGC